MRRGVGLGILLFVFLGGQIVAERSFSLGEQYFIENKPQEALPFLEAAVAEEPDRFSAFLYLGITYLQLERYDDAIGLYLQILPYAGEDSAQVAFNLGNSYYRKGDYIQAERYYTETLILDPLYGSAYLNRANTRINAGLIREAIPDYQQYLALVPESTKRTRIERLISFIHAEAAAEVRRQVYAEAEARAEEERRQVQAQAEVARLEAQARAEAERLTAEARRLEEDTRLEIARKEAEDRAAAIRRDAEFQAEIARQTAEAARQAAETRRLEQEAKEAEARRQAEVRAEQARQAAETERRRRLLEDVAASLQAASEESRGLSAGSDGVLHYDGEFELK